MVKMRKGNPQLSCIKTKNEETEEHTANIGIKRFLDPQRSLCPAELWMPE